MCFHALTHLILKSTPGADDHYPQLTDEETEGQGNNFSKAHASKWHSDDYNPKQSENKTLLS